MALQTEQQHREEFRNLLLALSKKDVLYTDSKEDETKIFEFIGNFKRLYFPKMSSEPFRHFYSDIWFVISELDEKYCDSDREFLMLNIDILRIACSKKLKQSPDSNLLGLREKLNKLYDHISLESAHLTYFVGVKNTIISQDNIKSINIDIDELNTKTEALRKKAESTDQAIDKSKRDYIAILGIFAAIVLAFTGGIAFSTSVLENMHQVGIYRAIGMALVIGLVLVNVLFCLFSYINHLVGRDTRTKDKSKREYILFGLLNAIFIIGLILTFIAWKNMWFERTLEVGDQARLIISNIFQIRV